MICMSTPKDVCGNSTAVVAGVVSIRGVFVFIVVIRV